ncbi:MULTISPECIES: DUF2948 family protein [Halocynthiibacter]|uniref:DUF2948 family protein n=1 Tax=Halocynthiibacter halioticoli TaxID=2986804 RepID=A0AAE3IZW5_9RHOB|nr:MULTISPECIES: DUF2948 family protein [Halocynthiibacter]MCV6825168.1 DUF2948 family protein [Halocynthiibacter halioticoli]MCW4058169.1 DUF2948 family protein [Halocynthiibacter sp. SDUM655004]MDE0588827.1 DUF2948 family protein [Halocynthiibacter sp. C4]
MSNDATFEDGAEKPLQLVAADEEDLQVISSVAQDAVFPISEVAWRPQERRFAILLNRFRWEDAPNAEARNRPYERVRSVLTFEDATGVVSQGIDQNDKDLVFSILSIGFEPGEDGTGRILVVLAGDGLIGVDVECLNVTLQDVTRPYIAPSKSMPQHPE